MLVLGHIAVNASFLFTHGASSLNRHAVTLNSLVSEKLDIISCMFTVPCMRQALKSPTSRLRQTKKRAVSRTLTQRETKSATDFGSIKVSFIPEAVKLPDRNPRFLKMCKLQHSYYNQCDHRTFRVTSVCRNRGLPGSKCRESSNLYFVGRCGPCNREQGENETPQDRQPDDWFVESRNPTGTSDTNIAEPYPRPCLEDLPALPDYSTSSEHEHSSTTTAEQGVPSKALQQLKLTDRFNTPPTSVSIPTFNMISYATVPMLRTKDIHNSPLRDSFQSLIGYYNGLDSGYECADSAPVSPSSSSPLTSSTTSSSNPRPTILSDLWDIDSIYMRSYTIGRGHAGCRVIPKKPKVKDNKEESIDLEVVRCKHGTHKVLNQPGDLPNEEQCWWHDTHRDVQEQGHAIRTFGADDS